MNQNWTEIYTASILATVGMMVNKNVNFNQESDPKKPVITFALFNFQN